MKKTKPKTSSKSNAKPSAKAKTSKNDPANGSDDELSEVLGAMVDAAKAVREHAYAPYSKYKVGAAILTESGDMFTGCNVENASFGATICAERGAVMAMVAAGQSNPILGVIVVQGNAPAAPCGLCRQVLAEFTPNMKLVCVSESKKGDQVKAHALDKIFPEVFRLK